MLESDGAEKLSFRAVARAAGVSQTAPYNHFANKADLLGTLAANGFADLVASQRAALATEASPTERILALGHAYLAFAIERPQRYRLMFGADSSVWRQRSEEGGVAGESIQPLRETIAQHYASRGVASPEAVEAAVLAAWALVHGLAMLQIDGPRSKFEALGEPLIDATLTLLVKSIDAY